MNRAINGTITYQWRGPEEPLGSDLIVARYMSVHRLEDQGDTLSARGGFTFGDLVERSEGDCPWVAEGTCLGETFNWRVRRREPYPDECVWIDRDTREPLFCRLEEVNAAIKAFVARRLSRVVRYALENPGPNIVLVDEPARYEGRRYEYAGDCLCPLIISSNKDAPFDWNGYTDGGAYPANCFKCSCGNGWFRGNPEEELWIQVVDGEAWYVLTTYNGVAVQSVGLDPRSRVPRLMLARNIRQMEWIPIG